MDRPADTKPLPEITPDRLLGRIAEAIQVAVDPAKIKTFPIWTQRVMHILRDQFIPREYASILSGDGSFFTEGVAVAWAAKARDLAQARGAQGGRFAQTLAERLGMNAQAQEVAIQVEAGTFTASPEFQQHVMDRLFAQDFAARRAFVEGLAIGNRLPELLDRQAKSNTTDATTIYLLLWFYWPEISKMKSCPRLPGRLRHTTPKTKTWRVRIGTSAFANWPIVSGSVSAPNSSAGGAPGAHSANCVRTECST